MFVRTLKTLSAPRSYTEHLSLAEFVRDPYPHYRGWRENDPVLWDPDWQAWLVTGYAEVEALLKSPCLSSELLDEFLQRVPGGEARCPAIARHLPNWILYLDEPRHQHLRQMVSGALTPAAVALLEPLVEAAVESLLDELKKNGPEVDLLADFAMPLTAGSLFALLGGRFELPAGCVHWAERFARFIGCERQTAAMVETAEQVVLEIEALFQARLADRSDPLLAAIPPESYGRQEILAMCSQLLLAGQDTTAGLIANGTLALLQQPDAWSELVRKVDDPAFATAAVEELLRFDCPSQLASRRVVDAVEVSGHQLIPGQLVNLFMGAANRDQRRFPNPDFVQLSRAHNRHLAFGRGRHFCVGAALARLQGRLALGALARQFPRMRLRQTEFPRDHNLVLRSLKSLRVALW